MSDPAAQLAALRTLRPLAADAAQGAALDGLIAALEAQLAASEPPADSITVGDIMHSQAVAIGAGATARVYIDGRQHKTNDDLLAAYYQRLAQRCQAMPLQGIYKQRTTRDSLEVDIDKVYTELATTALVERERLEGETLARFDTKAFLTAHTGASLLPATQRTAFRLWGGARDRQPEAGLGNAGLDIRPDLATLTAQDLARYAQEAAGLTFLGPQLVSEAIALTPRLVLLGEPGSGKSTALRYLAYTLAWAGLDAGLDLDARLAGWSYGRRVPIFAPLLPLARRFAVDPTRQGDAEDLWEYLVGHLQPNGANAGLAAAVHEEIEAGRAILLLDGLDEVAGAESRRKVVRAVRSFAARYPDCRMVVACRVRAYAGERNAEWQLPGWPSATLADWTLGQMQTFVRAWYMTIAELRDRPAEWRDERIAGLMRAIETREDLQRFGRQPLMLTVMALVHLNDGRLPEERASLYGRCIDILLGQWEIAGKDASEYRTLMEYIDLPDADAQSLRPLLGRAAYEAHRAAKVGEVGRLSRAVLRTMVDDELKRRGHQNPSWGADRFLEYTDQRAGLIQASDAGDEYAFPHQTFQEYLAGIELVGGVDPLSRILELRSDDRWRRPILLGIEQLALSSLDVPFRLLSHLVEVPARTAAERTFDLLLAQEIADDLGWSWLEQRDALFAGVKRRLAQALADTLNETAAPAAELVQAGAILAGIGDPRPGVCDLPPAMVELPGGSFTIGSTLEQAAAAGQTWEQYWLDQGDEETAKQARMWPENEINDQPLVLAPFAIGRYPLTNAQYAQFIEAGGYDPSALWWDEAGRAWLSRDGAATKGVESWQRRQFKDQPEFWDNNALGRALPNYPVVGVNWYEATAFCRWLTSELNDGYVYTLPSEAEWEYAARGAERRIYPWRDAADVDDERANFNGRYNGTTVVGCFLRGATPEGVLDLAGNVWEWTRSEYRDYPYDPTDGREDGTVLAQKRFTLRGGSWLNLPVYLRAAYRGHGTPDFRVTVVGFRLARHPKV